jgi:hypothetical protein
MNRLIATISIIIILVLLVVSAFLISNTVTVGINVRKEEIAIQKLIGATNAFVRLPFILEGILIGLIGAAIPLIIIYFVYNKAVSYILSRFSVLSSFMNGLLPVNSVYRILLPVGLILGVGIALIGSLASLFTNMIGIKGKKSGKFSLFSFFVGIIVTLVVLVCGVIIYLAVPYIGSTDDPLSAGSLKKLFEIVALVKSDYLEDVDGEDMTDGMYSGLMSSLGDEYAAYYTKDEIDSIKMSQAGKMKGIGISFTMDDETGYVLVEDVTEDGPADKAGLKVNDLITSIDGESTEDLSTSEVKSLIQDSDSDTVSLTVDRDGEELDFSVEKDYIENTQIVVGGMLKDSEHRLYR